MGFLIFDLGLAKGTDVGEGMAGIVRLAARLGRWRYFAATASRERRPPEE